MHYVNSDSSADDWLDQLANLFSQYHANAAKFLKISVGIRPQCIARLKMNHSIIYFSNIIIDPWYRWCAVQETIRYVMFES